MGDITKQVVVGGKAFREVWASGIKGQTVISNASLTIPCAQDQLLVLHHFSGPTSTWALFDLSFGSTKIYSGMNVTGIETNANAGYMVGSGIGDGAIRGSRDSIVGGIGEDIIFQSKDGSNASIKYSYSIFEEA